MRVWNEYAVRKWCHKSEQQLIVCNEEDPIRCRPLTFMKIIRYWVPAGCGNVKLSGLSAGDRRERDNRNNRPVNQILGGAPLVQLP
jgi:hypothetical protein